MLEIAYVSAVLKLCGMLLHLRHTGLNSLLPCALCHPLTQDKMDVNATASEW